MASGGMPRRGSAGVFPASAEHAQEIDNFTQQPMSPADQLQTQGQAGRVSSFIGEDGHGVILNSDPTDIIYGQ